MKTPNLNWCSLIKERRGQKKKTFGKYLLMSKKRYIGMLYEFNPHKGKRKAMGLVLKRRDNANIVKIIYGGVIDIILNEVDINKKHKVRCDHFIFFTFQWAL